MKIQLFFVMLASLFIGQRANACSCIAASVQEARDWADVVFAGEVTKVQYVDAQSDKLFNEPRIIVTLKVSDAWKGDVQQTMTIHTTYNKVSCGGLIVKVGDKFLIYAKKLKAKDWLRNDDGKRPLKGITLPKPDDNILEDGGACGRSGPVAYAQEDLKTFGKSRVPQ